MKLHCLPINPKVDKPLIFEWNPETGEVSGPGAEEVKRRAAMGGSGARPLPWALEFGPNPLRSLRDMALIVGMYWELPPELAPHYPVYDQPPNVLRDMDGNVLQVGED